MSHKTTIKTELTKREYLVKALKKLGFTYTEADAGEKLNTKGHYGVHENVDIRIEGNGSVNYDGAVGFKAQADGTYVAVGDFYGLRTQDGQSVSANMLKCEVTAHSKEAEVNDRLMNLGFTVDQQNRTENKEYIEILFTREILVSLNSRRR